MKRRARATGTVALPVASASGPVGLRGMAGVARTVPAGAITRAAQAAAAGVIATIAIGAAGRKALSSSNRDRLRVPKTGPSGASEPTGITVV